MFTSELISAQKKYVHSTAPIPQAAVKLKGAEALRTMHANIEIAVNILFAP